MRWLYNISIYAYWGAITTASLYNKKAKLWVNGRKNIFINLKLAIPENKKVIWMHCASLGEFEQGRPVLEALKEKHPNHFILLTFFSPSGFEIRKNYEHADLVSYLPIDTKANARQFINICKPSMAIFVKYEFWFNYLSELKQNQIPTYFISTIFRPSQHFFKWYGGWFRKQLDNITHFYVQNLTSLELLRSINITNADIAGDTRFDRVTSIAKAAKQFPQINAFKQNHPVFIAGSTWPVEDQALINLIKQANNDFRFIIAAHNIDNIRINSFVKALNNKAIRFSELTEENASKYQVVVVDGIGYLSHLYQYGNIAYIGGGFGRGLHNILEAATFGLPVVIGPNHHKFAEAIDLKTLGGAFAIENTDEIIKQSLDLMQSPATIERASKICLKYIEEQIGATEKIVNGIV